jgi:hypothetical protein
MISYEVAQNFIVKDTPAMKDFNSIIEKSAPKMQFIRTTLGTAPDECVNVDMDELLFTLVGYHNGDPGGFRTWFPLHNARHCAHYSTFEGNILRDIDFQNLQARVEGRLKTNCRCALSFWHKGHAVTGCFNTRVRV